MVHHQTRHETWLMSIGMKNTDHLLKVPKSGRQIISSVNSSPFRSTANICCTMSNGTNTVLMKTHDSWQTASFNRSMCALSIVSAKRYWWTGNEKGSTVLSYQEVESLRRRRDCNEKKQKRAHTIAPVNNTNTGQCVHCTDARRRQYIRCALFDNGTIIWTKLITTLPADISRNKKLQTRSLWCYAESPKSSDIDFYLESLLIFCDPCGEGDCWARLVDLFQS